MYTLFYQPVLAPPERGNDACTRKIMTLVSQSHVVRPGFLQGRIVGHGPPPALLVRLPCGSSKSTGTPNTGVVRICLSLQR
jgi:hypothetical protein